MSFLRNLSRRKKKVSWDQIVTPAAKVPSDVRVTVPIEDQALSNYKQWKNEMQEFNRLTGHRKNFTEQMTSVVLDHPRMAKSYIDSGLTTKKFIAYTAAERAANNPDLAEQYIRAGLTNHRLITLQELAYKRKQELSDQADQAGQEIIKQGAGSKESVSLAVEESLKYYNI